MPGDVVDTLQTEVPVNEAPVHAWQDFVILVSLLRLRGVTASDWCTWRPTRLQQTFLSPRRSERPVHNLNAVLIFERAGEDLPTFCILIPIGFQDVASFACHQRRFLRPGRLKTNDSHSPGMRYVLPDTAPRALPDVLQAHSV